MATMSNVDDESGVKTDGDTTGQTQGPLPTSRLETIWKDHETQWQKVEALERKMDETIMRKRRRLTNLIDHLPAHRRSHLRVFLSPTKTGDDAYSITLEGRLMIGHLDHQHAAKIDKELFDGNIKVEVDPSDRSQYRGGMSERESDSPVEPIQFTHFFDAVRIHLRTVWQPASPQKESPTKGSNPKQSKATPSKRNKKRASTSVVVVEEPVVLTPSAKTTLSWRRKTKNISIATSPDSSGFVIPYKTVPPPTPDLIFHSIVAQIELVPRKFPEELQYKPSKALATAMFPQHMNTRHTDSTDAPSSGGNEPGQGSGGGNGSGEPQAQQGKKKKRKTDSSVGVAPASEQKPPKEPVPTFSDIFLPATLNMKEVCIAFFHYAREHSLTDDDAPGVIVCNEPLQKLFGSERIRFAELPMLLVSKQLVEDASHDATEITYVVLPETMDDPAFSFDMDICVPSLFPYRCRELLRRVKQREFEYTSSRTRARNGLQAGRAQEEVVQLRLKECVEGNGFTKGHIPVWIALAKAATPNSEARIAAQLDAKICYLLERAEQHTRAAQASWDVVEACTAATPVESMD